MGMTLQQWIDRGGCNISNDCMAAIRHYHRLREKDVRAMPLLKIFALKPYGDYARRQIKTFRLTRGEQLRRRRRTPSKCGV